MKRCPTCQQTYSDEQIRFCRNDGALLIDESSAETATTLNLSLASQISDKKTQKFAKTPSIAVLNFTNLSIDPENEYFCDGLAEEILNALAKIENLKVAARTSSFSFKGKNASISEISRALRVESILEGSVRKSGDRLRINVQLINAADGYQLWSERYDREMQDIFDVQDEITLAVVSALKIKLLGKEKSALLKHYTDNSEAYELYLKGYYYFHKWTIDNWLKSIECFEKTIEIEPNYAPAYAGISNCYIVLLMSGCYSPDKMIPKLKAAASRALEIDDNLAEAHVPLANLSLYYERDWAETEQRCKKAIALNPNIPYAHQLYGILLAIREQPAQAISSGMKALEIDPLSPLVRLVTGEIYLLTDLLDEASEQVQRIIELEPNFNASYSLAGEIHLARGNYHAAIEAFQKSLALDGTQAPLSRLGCAYGLAGKQSDAVQILNQLHETREREYATAFNIARVYIGLGDYKKAFEWLDKSAEERDGELVFLDRYLKIGTGQMFGEKFRTQSQLQDFLRRINLAP